MKLWYFFNNVDLPLFDNRLVCSIIGITILITRTDRYCKKTTVINGVTIPKGAVVTVPVALLHCSPQYWKDPDVFDPERLMIHTLLCTVGSATFSTHKIVYTSLTGVGRDVVIANEVCIIDTYASCSPKFTMPL